MRVRRKLMPMTARADVRVVAAQALLAHSRTQLKPHTDVLIVHVTTPQAV
ncbi:hypothetical protein [Massilia antarctica]|nr:hypothetical protein [Massilia sp. H27-R4]MCY0912484.1 hypothetical protein [Massilia sp. H27-R4]CUI03530.1 hypothetical protein BN2497_1837 [Janthinobacterium sp. CG23_2]CUU27316.1 hypothetical protein BN3177_1837 [Janthinobacterium sp. CG23_2]